MEAKGDQHVHEAKQALKKWSLFGGSDKYENAAELFQRAGNAYKAAKAWDKAAEAFVEAANNFKKAKSDFDVTAAYVEAARAFVRAGQAQEATNVLENEALPRMVDAGRLSQAAKLEIEIAELFENEDDKESAIIHYQKGAEYYLAENATSTANKAMVKVAMLSAQLDPPDYRKASETFEQLARDSMSSNLLKFSAKGYLLQAILCQLANGDSVAADMLLNRAEEIDYSFKGSREGNFAKDLLEAFMSGNTGQFGEITYNYDQISRLDPWHTSVLLQVKNKISSELESAGNEALL